MCCESTYSGVGAKKVPQNIVLKTTIVRGSCGVDAVFFAGYHEKLPSAPTIQTSTDFANKSGA